MKMNALDARIETMREEMVADIRRWLSINSVNAPACGKNAPFGEQVRRALDMALEDGRKYGFEVKDMDGYCGEIAMGSGDEIMGMLCHLDIVPAGDGWTKDPFGGEIENGKLYGRGAMDDKGPAVAALYAMRAVKELGIPLKHQVRLILGCDEETGMTDMAYYRSNRGSLPSYGFSPDAEFPVINIEKGRLHLVLSAQAEDEQAASIPVYSLYAGERPNVVPAVAKAVVGTQNVSLQQIQNSLQQICSQNNIDVCATAIDEQRAELVATGVSSHAACPELGKNAAGMLLVALAALNAGGATANAIQCLANTLGTAYDGEGLGIKQSDEESGPLTCNLGILRYDGRTLQAHLDIRYPISASQSNMCGNAVLAVSPYKMNVNLLDSHTPHHVPADHRLVKGLLKVYAQVTGKPAYAFAIGGGTYSRCMPNTVAFGINFPGDVDTCHMPDEYIEIDKLIDATKIFAHAIVELAGEQK